ncbi:MAG: hypothetical protein QOF25_3275, partial [Mycobacterium sp.]|nr:hypothetical protein [Mycobacterium sp.]
MRADLGGVERRAVAGDARQDQSPFDERDHGLRGLRGLVAGSPVPNQAVGDGRAPAGERTGRGVTHLRAGVDGFGGDGFDRAAVPLVTVQTDGEHVDPRRDDLGGRTFGGEERAQEPLDIAANAANAANAVDDGGREFGLAVREVVLERAGLDVGGRQDLVDAGRRVALPAEQQRRA